MKLIVANWKANPDGPARAVFLAKKIEQAAASLKNIETVIAPPFPFLIPVEKAIGKVKLGAQDVFKAETGPFTGEVVAHQLWHLGVSYVIVGHSERRTLLNETDHLINEKMKAAVWAGLRPVLCVGEPFEVRKKGLGAAKAFVKRQLTKALKGVRGQFVVAYEPIWAISTSGIGIPDSPEETAAMANFIKHHTKAKVIYGGSVTAKNAKHFFAYSEIDGALVGGASLRPDEFKKIITAAANAGE